jgi:hypothetical protein
VAKFRIRLKLQGLELEVDGEREDIPAITAAVQQQLNGLVQPSEAMADGHKQLEAATQIFDSVKTKGKGPRKPRATGQTATDSVSAQQIEFRHDASKYGNPLQTWSVLGKCIWLLSVIEGIAAKKEVSAAQLVATFNLHFKAAGKLHPPNVTRDLSKAKVQNPASVGEDKGLWYLTDEGKRSVQVLVQNVLKPA